MAKFEKDMELKNYKLPDSKTKIILRHRTEKNLCCEVRQTQKGLTKTFLYIYNITENGKQKRHTITIGEYPVVSLSEAKLQSINMTMQRKQGNSPKKNATKNINFIDLYEEWWKWEQDRGRGRKASYDQGKKHLLPFIGAKNINDLERKALINLFIKRQEEESNLGQSHETSNRIWNVLKRVLNYGVLKGVLERNEIGDIEFSSFFKTSQPNNFRAITDTKVLAKLLQAVDNFCGNYNTKQALIFGFYTFLRSQNVRSLKWSYIDFDKEVINFPASSMKMKDNFVMPMSRQVKNLLEVTKNYQNNLGVTTEIVFYSDISKTRQMSENTLNQAIKRLGFGDETVFHGFRSTASTLLNENKVSHGLDSEVIELCLDHKERNKIKAIYDRSKRLDERKKLMQWWSDYLDELKG